MTDGSLRLDKWLWFARFFKSRTLASTYCEAGRIRIDGAVVHKAHQAVRPGQVLTFVRGRHVRVVRVVALGSRRGPAHEAQALYEDLAAPDAATRLPAGSASDPLAPSRERGTGRPTKKQRRETERFTQHD